MAGTKLIPCPFCGGEPDEYEGEYGNGIYCMECGAMVGEPIHLGFNIAERVSYEQAVKAWNTRAERTCRIEYPFYGNAPVINGQPRCSECKTEFAVGTFPHYCPNCGARVIGGNE